MIPDGTIRDLARRLEGHSYPQTEAVPCDLDPLDFVKGGWPHLGPATYFSAPDGAAIGGLGVAWEAEATGRGRLEIVDEAVRGLPLDIPVLVGFGFFRRDPRPPWSDFSSAAARIPKAMAINGADPRLVVTLLPDEEPGPLLDALERLDPSDGSEATMADPESLPDEDEWMTSVEQAIEAIAAGSVVKVVLARSLHYQGSADPRRVLSHFATGDPVYTYAWGSGDSTFIGASPELLVRKAGDVVVARPMAGTAPATTPDLLSQTKPVEEHGLVVADMIEHLGGVADNVAATVPRRANAGDILHLQSEVTATARDGASLLTFADAIHPTGAVGGVPRGNAAALISRLESIDRGWYSGAVGWMRPDGDGELALAIRCGLLGPQGTWLFAGNGIVAASDPSEELEETRPKFSPMMKAIGAA